MQAKDQDHIGGMNCPIQMKADYLFKPSRFKHVD